MRDLGCFCRARLRLQQARGLTWVPCVGSTQGLPQTPDLLGVRFVISSDSAEPVPAEIPALCGPSCIVLCCSFGAVGEAPRTAPPLKSAAAQLIFHRKENVFLFPFECLWQQLGVGRNLCFNKGKKMSSFSKRCWPTLFGDANLWLVSENFLFFQNSLQLQRNIPCG